MICLSLKPMRKFRFATSEFPRLAEALRIPRCSLVAMELQLLDWKACAPC